MASLGSTLIQIVAPKKTGTKNGVGYTGTFNPQSSDRVLTIPQYREHLTDIFTSRSSNDSRTLLKDLFKHDPDVSAAVFSYLTMANTDPLILVRDINGEIDKDATQNLHQALKLMTVPTDYTLGFQMKQTLREWSEEMRYMGLLTGAIGVELILNDKLIPSDLRQIDMTTIQWYEKQPGNYKPIQKPIGSQNEINMDIPTFFVSFFKQDPTTIYSYSPFVSAINTIAARQQVINDLYRIMQKTGYPRMDVKVVEEVLVKNLPSNLKTDANGQKAWVNDRIAEISALVQNIRVDQAFVHTDAVEPSIMNEKAPGIAVDISSVIETLNAQNQAGLKTMSTVIGRGASGVNTGSVEARIAAMNADELNVPVAVILTNICSFILHSQGYQGFAEVTFQKAELRPDLELEPQLTLRSARLRQDLSDGILTDIEYHLMMYNRLPPDGAPELSGTKFTEAVKTIAVDASNPSPNGDPLGRGLAPEGGKASKSKGVKASLVLDL